MPVKSLHRQLISKTMTKDTDDPVSKWANLNATLIELSERMLCMCHMWCDKLVRSSMYGLLNSMLNKTLSFKFRFLNFAATALSSDNKFFGTSPCNIGMGHSQYQILPESNIWQTQSR